MPKEDDQLELDGVVIEAVRGGFIVEVAFNENKLSIMSHLGGKMRKNYIRVVPGDRVKIVLSPYDLTKGRIIYRDK
jgi:translation initiation factor IF-1